MRKLLTEKNVQESQGKPLDFFERECRLGSPFTEHMSALDFTPEEKDIRHFVAFASSLRFRVKSKLEWISPELEEAFKESILMDIREKNAVRKLFYRSYWIQRSRQGNILDQVSATAG